MHDHHNCNNCVRKQAWLRQTGGKRRDFKNVFTELTIAENTGEADLIVHFQRQRQRIADQLRAALGVFKYAQNFIQDILYTFLSWIDDAAVLFCHSVYSTDGTTYLPYITHLLLTIIIFRQCLHTN